MHPHKHEHAHTAANVSLEKYSEFYRIVNVLLHLIHLSIYAFLSLFLSLSLSLSIYIYIYIMTHKARVTGENKSKITDLTPK